MHPLFLSLTIPLGPTMHPLVMSYYQSSVVVARDDLSPPFLVQGACPVTCGVQNPQPAAVLVLAMAIPAAVLASVVTLPPLPFLLPFVSTNTAPDTALANSESTAAALFMASVCGSQGKGKSSLHTDGTTVPSFIEWVQK
jgi:hypothetical protein